MEVKNIGIFGRRNAGKSSLINALLGQDFAIVSPEAGTTTDPVKKRMEIPGAGPCNLIDTAGMDDAGEVGNRRVEKSRGIMDQADLALLVFSGNRFGREEESLLEELKKRSVPVIAVHNRSDQVKLEPELAGELQKRIGSEVLEYSCCAGDVQARQGMRDRLLARIAEGLSGPRERGLLEGLVNEKDRIVLVCPVDSGAPHGRLILPQVMAIRDILDRGATAVVVQPSGLEACLRAEAPVKLVVTDSQAFAQVGAVVPEQVPLTSFSILMSRAKGPFGAYLQGAEQIRRLQEGEQVLILESCTHRAGCEDIGRVKIPRMLERFTGKNLRFRFVSGLDEIPFPDGDAGYALAVQCGGCMVTRRQLESRIGALRSRGIPVTNYGMALAVATGIFDRAVAIFGKEA